MVATFLSVIAPSPPAAAAVPTPGADVTSIRVLDTFNRQSGDGWALISWQTDPNCPTIEPPDGNPTWGVDHDWFGPAISPYADQNMGGAGCYPGGWPGYDAAPQRWVIRKCFTAPGSGFATVVANNFRGDGGARVRINGADVGLYGQWNAPATGGSARVPVTAGTNCVDIEVRDIQGPTMVQGILDVQMVQQFAVQKTASTTNALPGETVTYTVTVRNTGDLHYTAANPASFTDNLAGVLDDATYNGDVAASAGNVLVNGSTVAWSGPLAVDATATITYSVTVNDPAGDYVMDNVVTTPPEGSCETAAAGCTSRVLVPNLKASKVADTEELVPGDTITYTITLTNDGPGAFTANQPATFTDDLTDVLDDAIYNQDVVASDGAMVNYDVPVLSWSGPIPAGESVTVTYTVTVQDLPPGGEHNYRMENRVVTSVGTCREGSTDPACLIILPVPQVEVEKTADFSKAVPGGTATYTIVVTNVGEGDFTEGKPVSFTDDLSGVLDDATYNGDAAISDGSAATFEDPILSWAGPLPAGESVTITYSVTIDDVLGRGDGELLNVITTPFGNCKEGSIDPRCRTRELLPELRLQKTVDVPNAKPGDVVTYTVTVRNIGRGDFTAERPASFTDDLSDVLDDATYNRDASASDGSPVSFDGPTLAWQGAVPAGGTVTVRYSFTVNDPMTGNSALVNHVTSPTGNCVEGSGDPACTTETPIVPPITAEPIPVVG